ncbi:MAG TPA: hypothetical protein VF212_13375, partial [Longimicrobiales bacterium]
TDNYRHLAIDNVFYRGFTEEQAPAPAPAEVYDLLAAVSGAAGVAYNLEAERITSFTNLEIFNEHLNVVRGQRNEPGRATPGIRDIGSFVLALDQGIFSEPFADVDPPARRAAEFVHLCVSDHLPVIFTMNL